ncbi:MAG TPA: PKD domain-containing protein [Gemmatimonadaceae bacterium]|nr:PKD domain-containing protein [Gemmatimonadaceae bacterium]
MATRNSSAITQTLLTAGNNAVNQKIYTTASISPAPGALVLLAVMGHRAYGANPSPIVTGGGVTGWDEVATVTFDPVGSPLKRVTLYRAMSNTPGSGPITITFANAVSNAQWIVTQWEGVDGSGTNGSGAIVQAGTARADGASGLTVDLVPFQRAGNTAYGVFAVRSSVVAITPGSGFAEVAEVPSAETPFSDLQAEWGTNDPTIDASWTSLNAAALGVEINAGGVPVATVDVTPSDATVDIGGTVQLTATPRDASGDPLNGRAITWATSDPEVATVDGAGLATGVAPGAATITATSEGVSGTSAITVASVAVATVEVSPATESVTLGARVQLTATPRDVDGEPLSRPVTWATSAPAVASVNGSGLVTALYEGSATITATSEGTSGTATITVTAPPAGSPAMMVTAGDIAVCGEPNDEATALLLDGLPGTVVPAGDNVYEDGTAADFANCYEPSWGRHKARTRPVAGNHEYDTPNAAGYFGYFGAAAGDPDKGYYSFDVGNWHVVVLNSNIPVSAGSPQEQWLRADLAASATACQVAVWHHPRFTTNIGRNTDGTLKPLWDALYVAGAELIINGHDHSYQRYAPQTPAGVRDDAQGIRQITVGTGGAALAGFGSQQSNVEARNSETFGVLQLTLRSDGYDWKFVPVAGQTFTDEGSGTCHAALPNQAPIARPGGPYRSEAAVTFQGGASIDPDGNTPLTYAWDFGDGSTGTGATTSHTYLTDGVYTVTLVVTDALGLSSAPAMTTATIANIAPTVNAGSDVFVQEEQSFNLSASFTDPGADDGSWTYRIDWGDGETSSGTAENQNSPIIDHHEYDDDGAYTVRVTVTDKDGGAGFDELTVTVTDDGPAAITPKLVTFGNSPVNQGVYTTASISPAPDALVLLAVMGHRSYGANPSPIVTGGGMTTWVEVATVTFDPVGSPLKRITLYRAMSSAPGSGPITITFPNNVSNAQWIVTQWEGVDVSGTNGSGAIVQTGSARADAVSGLAVALASFESATNAAYGVFGVNSSTVAIAPGSGFAEMAEAASAESPPSALQAEWATNVNTVAALWSSLRAGALAVEIRARP